MTLKDQLRVAGLMTAAMFGRFGATKENSPEAFMPGVEITGYRGKVKERKKNNALNKHITDASRWAARWKTERNAPAERLARHLAKAASQVPGSMRGSDELRTQRLRRAYGVAA